MFRLASLCCVFAVILGCARDEAPSTPSTAAPTAAAPPAADSHVHADGTVHGNDEPHGQIASIDELATTADLPIYPGAATPEGVSNVRTDGAQTRYEIVMNTPDSIAKVREFYSSKLKLDSKSKESADLMGMTPKQNYAIIKLVREGDTTKISAVVVAQTTPKS